MKKLLCLLLVDDDSIATFLNKGQLKKFGIDGDIETAINGKDALTKIDHHFISQNPCPQLLFLDINMPVMNGFEFLEEFNKLDRYKRDFIHIVALTSSDHGSDKIKMSGLGVKYYLTKPLNEEKLNKVFNEIDF